MKLSEEESWIQLLPRGPQTKYKIMTIIGLHGRFMALAAFISFGKVEIELFSVFISFLFIIIIIASLKIEIYPRLWIYYGLGVFLFLISFFLFFPISLFVLPSLIIWIILLSLMWVLFSPPPPLFVNPDSRKIARGDEILFENVPQNANVILQRKFGIETFYYEGTHYRYKIYWQILIEDVKTGTHGVLYRQEWTKNVFLRTNCQWIENMAYRVAEILTLPILDITGTESIILKPEQQKLPLTSLYKDEYSSNVVTCDEEGPNVVTNQNGYNIQVKSTKTPLILIPGVSGTKLASLIFVVVGSALGLIVGLNIINSIELGPPGTDILVAVAYGLVVLWYLNNGLKPHSVIHVSPKRITIRNMSWSSVRKRIISLEKLRHINVVNLWGEVRSLEFVTEDNRIMLHGNYEEAQHLREMILKILTKSTIVIHEKD